MSTSPTVICLMGPTAVGKTDVAVDLAKTGRYELVSVDSAMVYRGLDIGSAKPSAAELAQAPHRLIDIRDVTHPYSAADFQTDAVREIEDIVASGNTPLLVGGTMLYFKALQQGLSTLPCADPVIRAKLLQQGEQHGWQALHDRLKEIDPVAAKKIHPNDPQRLQRALEVYEITGKPISVLWQEGQVQVLPYHFVNVGLVADRALLHERIAKRFKHMIDIGLVDEVRPFFEDPQVDRNLPAMKSVGYQQVWDYLAGEIDQPALIEKGIVATRQLAKRQFTWLRSWPAIKLFDSSEALIAHLGS